MPDLTGVKLKAAEKSLDDIGVKVTTVDATGDGRSVWDKDNWTVASQNVDPGETVKKGQQVKIAILKSGERDVVRLSGTPTTTAATTPSREVLAEPTSTAPTTTTAPIAPVTTPLPVPTAARGSTAPVVIALPVSFAESKHRVQLDTWDLAPNLVPGMSGSRARTVFDKANWKVVAQCDTMSGGRVTVGVVKLDEWPSVAGSAVANNEYAGLLDC
ncbi:PASTA domain-containing protein [Rhodococcus sp. ACT016]|uniref:PASTA domain-containing protein n=1 Tax=Rhodococcus sp. ACT016 TaxID=3134808 RepID=UPI003D293102